MLTAADLRDVLSLTAQKQLLGCASEKCVTDAGSAVGTRYAVFGRLDHAGDLLILNLTLVDTQSAKVLRRASVTGDDEAALVDSARTAAGGFAAVLEEVGAERVLVLDVMAPLVDPPPPLVTITAVTTLIVGVAALTLTYLATSAFTAMVLTSIRVPETRPLALNFIPVVGALIGPFASPRDYGDVLFLTLGGLQLLSAVVAAGGGALWVMTPESE